MLLESLNVPRPAELVNLTAPGPKPGSHRADRPGTVMPSSVTRCSATCRRCKRCSPASRRMSPSARTWPRRADDAGQGLLVSGNYFQVLQVQPALGRLFDSNDDRLVGEAPVVVLGHGFWTTKFAADPNVLNKTIKINGQTLTIVGVAAPKFDGTTLGAKPECSSRSRSGPDESGLAWLERSHHLLGVSLRSAPARRRDRTGPQALNGQYRAILTRSKRRCSRT